MLYKKYVIEVIKEVELTKDVELNTSSAYDNQIQMSLIKTKEILNYVNFVNSNGSVIDYPHIFNTYDEAFNVLSTHYYSIKGDYSVLTISIRETYDDITPPIEVLRSMKIKKILK